MSTNEQVFVVTAESRIESSSQEKPALRQFLVEAESHRVAWKVAREVCKTGKGAQIRDPVTHQLHALPLVPGDLTVKRVLSTSASRRGRPPKRLVDDLLTLADDRGVKVPPRVLRVIDNMSH